jgi:3-methyladenine DNA glycosylase Mpg
MGGEPQFDRQSSLCFSCCFNGSNGEEEAPAASLLRSSSVWIREKARGIPGMVQKFNRNRKESGDFRYDPISYALNFDMGEEYDADLAQGEMLRLKNFSSRLPASPSVRVEERPSSLFDLSNR